MYEADWAGLGDMRFMNDIIIILSQRPLAFDAKGFMKLDMNMFSGVILTIFFTFFLTSNYDYYNSLVHVISNYRFGRYTKY